MHNEYLKGNHREFLYGLKRLYKRYLVTILVKTIKTIFKNVHVMSCNVFWVFNRIKFASRQKHDWKKKSRRKFSISCCRISFFFNFIEKNTLTFVSIVISKNAHNKKFHQKLSNFIKKTSACLIYQCSREGTKIKSLYGLKE